MALRLSGLRATNGGLRPSALSTLHEIWLLGFPPRSVRG